MVTIDYVVRAWYYHMGGEPTIYGVLSMLFTFTLMYVVYKITT